MEERYPGLLTKAHLWTDLVLLNFSFTGSLFYQVSFSGKFIRQPVCGFTSGSQSCMDLCYLPA